MKERDVFAAAALAGLIAWPGSGVDHIEILLAEAWKFADAMEAERLKRTAVDAQPIFDILEKEKSKKARAK